VTQENRLAERTSGKMVLGAIGASCCVPLAVAGGTIGGAIGIAGLLLLVANKFFRKSQDDTS